MSRARALAIGFLLILFGASPVLAQNRAPGIRGYYLNVGTVTASGPFNESSVADFQRLRLMTSPDLGPLALDLAYEHTLELRSAIGETGLFGVGAGREPGMWLGLQGSIESSERLRWRHRIDRAAVTVALGGSTEVTLGRQPISWATTLLLTPADPFVPFDVEDPFREYRTGLDAMRVQSFLGAFTELDFVLRPAKFSDTDRTISALGRFRTVVAGTEISTWLGVLHDELAGSVALTATMAGAAARAELVVREVEGRTRTRLAIGLDRSFSVAERDLYVVLEFQRDELGAAASSDLPSVLASPPARRGELLVLGRDAVAVQLRYSVHPLWTLDILTLTNLSDPSGLFGPAASYALSGETNLRMGLFFGLGTTSLEAGLPGSEFGSVPWLGYASFTAFF